MVTGNAAIFAITDKLIPSFEGFSAHPYWDVSRWSWGYGTPAPGPTGTISQQQAIAELRKHVLNDYSILSKKVTRHLKPNQWAALLSFSYNLGIQNASNLIPNINSGNDTLLHSQWKLYVYAGGVVNADLVERRKREWLIWQS